MANPSGNPPLPALEERINSDKWSRDALRVLLAATGIDHNRLWDCLYALDLSQVPEAGFERWEDRSRISRRQVGALARRLRRDADDLAAFLTPKFHWLMTVEHGKFLWFNLVQRHLKLTAALIDGLLHISDNRRADNTETARRRLTEYVQRATGKPHDREVADLIRVTLGLHSFTFEEQRKFRTRKRTTGRK